MSEDVSIFVGQSYFTFRVNMFQDLNAGSEPKILVKKHDGTRVAWPAVIDNEILTYIVQPGDIDQNGWWEAQGEVKMADERYIYGERFTFEVKPNLK